jgi:hypothetical protein
VQAFWIEQLEQLVTSVGSQHWYAVSGLIPQIIVLAIVDIAMLSMMSVTISLVKTVLKRLCACNHK